MIIYIFPHYFANIKVNSYDSLPIEKILTLHNVIIYNVIRCYVIILQLCITLNQFSIKKKLLIL